MVCILELLWLAPVLLRGGWWSSPTRTTSSSSPSSSSSSSVLKEGGAVGGAPESGVQRVKKASRSNTETSEAAASLAGRRGCWELESLDCVLVSVAPVWTERVVQDSSEGLAWGSAGV